VIPPISVPPHYLLSSWTDRSVSSLRCGSYRKLQNVTVFGSKIKVPVERLRNPAGFEFEVVTLERAGCRGLPPWTGEASWYPGYLWRVCVCPICRSQLGWMFEPEDSATEEREQPSQAGFYAIILSNVIDEDFASTLTLSPKLGRNPRI